MKGDLVYERSFELDGQARHLGRIFQAGWDLRRDRNDYERNILRRASGSRLVAGYEGLCDEAIQEVNQQHIGQFKEEVVKNTAFLFYIFRTQVTGIHGKIVS